MEPVGLEEATSHELFGGKAANLARAAARGFRVPPTLVVPCGEIERSAIEAAAARLLTSAPAGLAVRSSAVVEDGARASFAGVFESFVGVRTPADAYERVLDVRASALAPRAKTYAERVGLDVSDDAMAAMLQVVVPARRAGVITTADPDTGDPFTFVCHSAEGLAVDLLSGSGAGDVERIAWDDDGDLAALARRLDELWDARLDIEWARDDHGLWLLQVRPLTALPEYFPGPRPDDVDRLAEYVVPLRKDLPQGLVTPLYADLSFSKMWFRYQPDDIIFTGVWTRERDLNGYRFTDDRVERTFVQCFASVDDWEPWIAANEGRYRARWEARHDELREIDRIASDAITHTTTARELVEPWLDVRHRLWDLNSFGWSGPQALGWMCEGLLRQVVGWDVDVHGVIAGGSDSHTLAVTLALQELGRSLDEDVVLRAFGTLPLDRILEAVRGTRFLEDYTAFCWRFGRTPPDWRERPDFWRVHFDTGDTTALHAIRTAHRGSSRDARLVQQAALRDRNERAAAMRANVADPHRFDRVLGWARYWTQALNDRHAVVAGLLRERELLWQLGSRLVAEGTIDRPEDVLVFAADDLRTSDLSVYRERLAAYRRNRRLTAPRRLHSSEEAVPPLPVVDEPDDDVFTGEGVGSRTAIGRARIVRALDAAFLDSLGPDDVLVLTDEGAFMYADWHSLLTVIAAVASRGRPSHHLAQVARECGVPLVGHVRGDLTRIVEGAAVEVNAGAGTVRLV